MGISKTQSDRTRTASAFRMLALVFVVSIAGCRFNVGVLRSLLGDTLQASAFEARTEVNLSKGEGKLLILCTASHGAMSESASLPIDLLTKVASRLRNRGVNVVDTDDVATYMDDNGSLNDLPELAKQFEPDYIAVINIQALTYREANSTNLLRARASGNIQVYKVLHEQDGRVAELYGTAINEVYPRTFPIAGEKTSNGTFQAQALDYLSDVFARQFHSYHQRETI